jgi:hypothetical protein
MSRASARESQGTQPRSKSRVAVWRDAIRDSDLDRTAKLVAYTLSTYMSAAGKAWPSRATLALGASISDRAVDGAIGRLVGAGFLLVNRSDGGRSHTNKYVALISETANALRHSEWETANGMQETANGTTRNGERPSPESGKEKAKESDDAMRNFNCTVCGGELDEDLYCDSCRLAHRLGNLEEDPAPF